MDSLRDFEIAIAMYLGTFYQDHVPPASREFSWQNLDLHNIQQDHRLAVLQFDKEPAYRMLFRTQISVQEHCMDVPSQD